MATDYNAIARKRITRPAEQKSFPRFLIYARNKKGKTTFGISAGVDTTLVIDPEGGTNEMKTKNPHVWHIEKWEELDDVLNFLRFGTHNYEWVCIDGMTKFANIALKYVMRQQEEKSLDRIPGMVQQRDYGKAGELMKDLLNRAHALPMGVVFTAQERMEDGYDDDEDEDSEEVGAKFVADLPKGVRSAVNAIVDVIGRLYVVRVDDKAERRLWIGESSRYDTGYRSDFPLPDMVRMPTIPRMVRLMRTGSAAVKKPAGAAAKK